MALDCTQPIDAFTLGHCRGLLLPSTLLYIIGNRAMLLLDEPVVHSILHTSHFPTKSL